ncbi:uncharacterized protein RCO7_02232 [Rhynchosporium graminicola]|uniref:Uncharacterized protein n=1 Tax=Rhynchosporium graminicola TaxID=2792576 RepID=A0A1E1LH97_9HELO|nr:uncharacterized protein RCO7_02232 [Rhynchosporium commune]
MEAFTWFKNCLGYMPALRLREPRRREPSARTIPNIAITEPLLQRWSNSETSIPYHMITAPAVRRSNSAASYSSTASTIHESTASTLVVTHQPSPRAECMIVKRAPVTKKRDDFDSYGELGLRTVKLLAGKKSVGKVNASLLDFVELGRSSGKPTIIALHNVRYCDQRDEGRAFIHDPPLIPLGYKQCARLTLATPFDPSKITHVLSSPSRRCIQTVTQSLPKLNTLKELGAKPCNNGSSIAELKTEFANLDLRCELLDEGWEKDNLWDEGPDGTRIALRIRTDILALATSAIEHNQVNAHGNVEILLFSHGGLQRTLAGGADESLLFSISAHHPPPSLTSTQDLIPIPDLKILPAIPISYIYRFDKEYLSELRASGWKEEELAIVTALADSN